MLYPKQLALLPFAVGKNVVDYLYAFDYLFFENVR